MALRIGFIEPKKLKPAVREFTDRLEPVYAFEHCFNKVKIDGSTIITYYGAGGVGKTSLLKELVKKVDMIEDTPYEEVVYIQHNFENKMDLRQILHSFKSQLEDFGCQFPLFGKGDFCHAIKNGRNDVPRPKERSYLKKIISENPYASQILEIWDIVEDPLINNLTSLKILKMIIGTWDKWYSKKKFALDDVHERINSGLYERIDSIDPNAIYDYLPVLFAQDVADWINGDKKKKRYLVVFLDTFEALVNEENSVNIQRINDLWLRDDGSQGNQGMMFLIPNTLWVIAGRNKLRWTGEIAKELDQHLLKALSEYDSNQFLIKAGVKNQSVRDEIVEVTQGLPLYLDLCVDIYHNYFRVNGKEPIRSDFGEHYQEIIERLIKYMDSSTQDMVNFLSVLEIWTDDIANEIGAKALPNFSIAGYEQTKKFSFIQEGEELEINGDKTNIFKFDKTIQAVMFKGCSKIIIKRTKKAVEEYFSVLLNNESINGDVFVFYLKMWVDLIVRLTDNVDELAAQYEDNIKNLIQSDYVGIKDREYILTSFFDRVKECAASHVTSYAYFECEEADLRHEQGRYLEAYELAKSAYDKYLSNLGEADIKTISTARKLINELDSLDRQAEALPFTEKYFAIAKEHWGYNHDETLMFMLTLSNLLIILGRYDEGRALNKEWINLVKEKLSDLDEKDGSTFNELKMISKAIKELQSKLGEDSEDIIDLLEGKADILQITSLVSKLMPLMEDVEQLNESDANADALNQITMASMAGMILDDQDHMQEVLLLRRQILDSCKKVFGEKHLHTIAAMYNLADALTDLEQYEEALPIQQEVVRLRKELLGEKKPDTIYAMRALSTTLANLDNISFNDRFEIEKRIVELMLEVLGETHSDTIAAMDKLSNDISIYSTKQEMALPYLEQLVTLQRQTLGPEHLKTIETMNTISIVLNILGRYEEVLEQQQKVVEWRKNNCGENNFNTVLSICQMVIALLGLGRYDEALKLSTSTLDSLEQSISKTDISSDEIDMDYVTAKISILDCLALTLRHLKRYEESLNCYAEEINLHVDNTNDENDEEAFNNGIMLLMAFKDFAITLSMALRSAGKLNEALMLNQVMAEVFTNILDEDYIGTTYSMNEMVHVLVNMKRYDEALKIQEKVVDQAKNGAYFGEKHIDTIKFEDELLNMKKGNYDVFTLDEIPFENYIIDAVEYLVQNLQSQESSHHFAEIITLLKA